LIPNSDYIKSTVAGNEFISVGDLVFTVFQRRLYKDWFLFVDDLSVATGRKKCHGDGPSGAHDVSCLFREETEEEKARRCLGVKAGAAFPSPFAQVQYIFLCHLILLLFRCVKLVDIMYAVLESVGYVFEVLMFWLKIRITTTSSVNSAQIMSALVFFSYNIKA
jgi:hypothetical protein